MPTVTGNDEIWASGRAATRASVSVIAYIDVYNKPFTLQARKVSARTGEALSGAHFALYHSVKVIGGESKDYDPIIGYEDLVTGADGIIPKIDNTLDHGKYYLTELTAPENYEGFSGDIIFTISELGTVTMTGAGEEGMLTVSSSQEENAYVINVPNNPVYSPANLTLTKTVNGTIGNKDKEFTFTIKAEGADSTEQYEWTKNGVSQTAALHSNGTFTMKHGDTVVITLPKRVSITITEDNEDYTTSFKLNQEDPEYVNSKTFVLQDNATVAVVNTRNALLPTGVRLSATWCVVIMLTALAGVVFLVMWRRRAD